MDKEYFGNSVTLYLTAAGTFLVSVFVIYFFKRFILKKLRTLTETTLGSVDNYLVKAIEKTIPLAYLAAAYFAIETLTIHPKLQDKINIVFIIFSTVFVLKIITSILKFSVNSYVRKKEDSELRLKQVRGIIGIVNFSIWTLGIIFLLDNLGFQISAVIAGLGIGGIAIALAAQAILGDLFNYFVIFFDRPFEIGDFIIIGDKMGSIENIGIKSTRLRSLGGEQLIISNTDLTSSRLHNYKRMERRRVVFNFNVDYNTDLTLLNQIPAMIKEIVSADERAVFDRSHFFSFGNYGLNFETVYYVNSPEYNTYMDIQQSINFKIIEELKNKNVSFATNVIK